MGNWERLVWNQRDVFIAGFVVTLEVCLIAFAVAIVGGLVLCLVRLYVKPLRPLAVVLIEFFRDTPIFVQLMWVSYVWPELFGFPKSFFAAGWLALGLQSSGYLAETFRTGIEGVPRGQREAAFSAGMSPARLRALDRQPVPRDREVLALGLGDHRARPDVGVPAPGERLVRADRNPHRHRGDLHRLRVSRFARRQAPRRPPAPPLRPGRGVTWGWLCL